jgi:hypothetical protein
VTVLETVVPFAFVIVNVTVAPDNNVPAAFTVAFTVAVWVRVYVAWVGVLATESADTTEYVDTAEAEYAGFDIFDALTLIL